MKFLIFVFSLLLIFNNLLFSEQINPISQKIYLSNENLESRFQKIENSNKNNFLYELNLYNRISISTEYRDEKPLANFKFRNSYVYISSGHRYKPLNGFYILKDPKYYSAFQNPIHGIVEQPLERSNWGCINFHDWCAGIFNGKSFTKKGIGYFIQSPGEIFGLAYSKETENYFGNLNIRKFKWKKFKSNPEFSIISQLIGKKESFTGYINTSVFIPEKGILYEQSLYREEKDNLLFSITPDRFKDETSSKTLYSKLSKNFYDRLEYFTSKNFEARESIFGGNISIVPTKYGAICTGARIYTNHYLEKSLRERTTANSISYEYKKLSHEIITRIEIRQNKDRLGEVKWTYRPKPDWKIELSALIQNENNYFKSLYEQWSDGENINTILTDRITAIKLKLIGSIISLNVSGSKNKAGNEIYYSNIQFQFHF